MTGPEHYAGASACAASQPPQQGRHLQWQPRGCPLRCSRVPDSNAYSRNRVRGWVVILGTGVLVRHCTSPLPGWLVPAT